MSRMIMTSEPFLLLALSAVVVSRWDISEYACRATSNLVSTYISPLHSPAQSNITDGSIGRKKKKTLEGPETHRLRSIKGTRHTLRINHFSLWHTYTCVHLLRWNGPASCLLSTVLTLFGGITLMNAHAVMKASAATGFREPGQNGAGAPLSSCSSKKFKCRLQRNWKLNK